MAEKMVKDYAACEDLAEALSMYLKIKASTDTVVAKNLYADILEIQSAFQNKTEEAQMKLKYLGNPPRN
jgi:oligoendopeptidase F